VRGLSGGGHGKSRGGKGRNTRGKATGGGEMAESKGRGWISMKKMGGEWPISNRANLEDEQCYSDAQKR